MPFKPFLRLAIIWAVIAQHLINLNVLYVENYMSITSKTQQSAITKHLFNICKILLFPLYCSTTYTDCIIIILKGANTMATSPTQIRIDSNVKTEANELFSELGIDMSSAVNIFLRQCVLHGGLPFKVEIPKFNTETLAAMEEAKRISRDPNVPSYSSMEDLKKALLQD